MSGTNILLADRGWLKDIDHETMGAATGNATWDPLAQSVSESLLGLDVRPADVEATQRLDVRGPKDSRLERIERV